jgi:hypothetical protein
MGRQSRRVDYYTAYAGGNVRSDNAKNIQYNFHVGL